MQTVKIVVWEEDGAWLGYLKDYPDHWPQGETLGRVDKIPCLV
jgi:predicted RNase H-like HicB family nuclease